MRKIDITMLVQKLIGVGMIVLAAVTVIATDGDGTASLILAPIGAVLLFTKDKVLADNYYVVKDEEEES